MGNHEDGRFTASDAEIIRHKVRRLIGHYGWTQSDEADLQQEVAMHVAQRIDQYTPARAGRTTFVDRVCHNKVLNIIEGRRAIKRGGGRPPEPLDDGDSIALEFGRTAADLDQQMDVRDAIARLPEHLRMVAVQLSLEAPADAARSLGLSRQQMRTRMASIAVHLRAAGLGEKS